MARAPDKRIEQAKGMYLKGMKLVEIASQLNLPEGTVRRWKSTHRSLPQVKTISTLWI